MFAASDLVAGFFLFCDSFCPFDVWIVVILAFGLVDDCCFSDLFIVLLAAVLAVEVEAADELVLVFDSSGCRSIDLPPRLLLREEIVLLLFPIFGTDRMSPNCEVFACIFRIKLY